MFRAGTSTPTPAFLFSGLIIGEGSLVPSVRKVRRCLVLGRIQGNVRAGIPGVQRVCSGKHCFSQVERCGEQANGGILLETNGQEVVIHSSTADHAGHVILSSQFGERPTNRFQLISSRHNVYHETVRCSLPPTIV